MIVRCPFADMPAVCSCIVCEVCDLDLYTIDTDCRGCMDCICQKHSQRPSIDISPIRDYVNKHMVVKVIARGVE
jgi:hypothetical protein